MCVTQHASVVHTHDNVACGNKTKQVLAQEQRLSQRCVMCSVIHQCSVVPVSIFPSKAAGPSSTRLLICRNSSGSSSYHGEAKPTPTFLQLGVNECPLQFCRVPCEKWLPSCGKKSIALFVSYGNM